MSPLYQFTEAGYIRLGGGGTTDFLLAEAWFQSNAGCRIPKNQLTPHTGSNTLSTANAVYEGVLFTDSVWINAPGIQFIDCWFVAGPYGVIDNWESTGTEEDDGYWLSLDARFEHSTFECGSWTNCALLLRGEGWSASYCDIYGGQDGMKTGGTGRIYRTYIHDLNTSNPEEDHNDAIQVLDTVQLDVDESWLESHNTACIAAFVDQNTYGDISVYRTYLGGGAGYLIYAGGSSTTNFSVIGSVMGQRAYGLIAQWPVSGTSTWLGNTDEATGEPVYPDGGDGSAERAALFAARDKAGLLLWHQSHSGHRLEPTRTVSGAPLIDAAWLSANNGNGNVSFSGGRWLVSRILFDGGIRVAEDDITFRDVHVKSGGGYHGIHAPVGEDPAGIRIEHSTIEGEGADWLGVQFPSATALGQVVVYRCDISGYRCAVQIIGGVDAIENYVHDLYYDPVDPHVTSMSVRYSNVNVLRNWLPDGNSSALAFYNEYDSFTNILADGNVIFTDMAYYEATYLGTHPFGDNTVRLVGNLFERGALAYGWGNFSEISDNYTFAGAPVT